MTEIYLTISLSTHNGDGTPQIFKYGSGYSGQLKQRISCIFE